MTNRALTEKAMRFVDRVAENPDRPHTDSARLAGYSISSAARMPYTLFGDPRVVAALDERGIDITPIEPPT
jgi:phage terminase small subunit